MFPSKVLFKIYVLKVSFLFLSSKEFFDGKVYLSDWLVDGSVSQLRQGLLLPRLPRTHYYIEHADFTYAAVLSQPLQY